MEIIQVLKSRFALWSGLALILFFIAQQANERFFLHDFEVYFRASRNFWNNQQVYGIPFGLDSGYYKYAPFILLLFTPFSLMPHEVANVIFYFFIAVMSILTLGFLNQKVKQVFFDGPESSNRNSLIYLGAIIAGSALYRELHLGNVNMLLLLLFSIACFKMMRKESSLPGILIGLGLLFKPHFLVLIPLLVLRKQFRVLFFVFATLLSGLLAPALFAGWNRSIALTHEWVKAIVSHNSGYEEFPNTLYSWIGRFFPPTWFSDSGLVLAAGILGTIAIGFLLLVLYHKKLENGTPDTPLPMMNFGFEFFFLIALVPNITNTDTEHFLFSLPVLLFILNFLKSKKPGPLITIVSVSGFIFYGGNLGDFIGKPLSQWMFQIGATGFGNLLLLGVFLTIWLPPKKIVDGHSSPLKR